MATLVSHHEHSDPLRRELTPQRALKYAWFSYLAMGVVPLLYFLYVVWRFNDDRLGDVGDRSLANRWFIGCVAYMVLIVPASFFVRSRFFQAYWRGDCVAPGNYLKGMIVVWMTLVIGGLLSLTGCLVSGTFAPCILPAIVAAMVFAVMWPNGRAMICSVRGATDDPENYEEPR